MPYIRLSAPLNRRRSEYVYNEDDAGGVDKNTVIGIILALICFIFLVFAYQYLSNRPKLPRGHVRAPGTGRTPRKGTFVWVKNHLDRSKDKYRSQVSKLPTTETLQSTVLPALHRSLSEYRSRFNTWNESKPEPQQQPDLLKQKKRLRPLYLDINATQNLPIERATQPKRSYKETRGHTRSETIDQMFKEIDVVYSDWVGDEMSILETPASARISPLSPWGPLSTPTSSTFSESTPPTPPPTYSLPPPPQTRLRDDTLRAVGVPPMSPVSTKEYDHSIAFVIGNDSDAESFASH